MYYKKQVSEIFKELNTNEYGLSQEEAKTRLEEYGPNSIKEKGGAPIWKLILGQFTDPLIYILLIAALITLFIGEYIETGVIFVIVIINTIVGFFQEFKAEKAMQAIKELAAPRATVIRDSNEKKISSEDIVPGDIVLLTTGNKVPADIRLFEIIELEINESTFTGESVPSQKKTDIIEEENLPVADQDNMAFMGTIITHGKGKGVVVKTGEKTELGNISEQVKSTEKERTPLQKRLEDFSKNIGLISVGLSILVFIIGIIFGNPFIEMIVFALSMAVAVIPEGLPIVVTITMAIGIKRMADRNAIVRKLIAVETLGSCNYICSDKTGTITENRMTVIKAFTKDKTFEFKGSGYKPEGEILSDGEKIEDNENLHKLLLCGLLCNGADLYQENNEWKVEGDPTEGSLIVSARKFGIDQEESEYQYKQINELPFSSERQYMATMHEKNNSCYIFVKGSPEKMLVFSGNKDNKELLDQYSKMTESGLRVLGFGMKKLEFCPEDFELEATKDLEFLGFQGLMDPPRKSVIEAIKGTKESGIKTVMITGDHKKTATAIARQIGIFEEDDMAITGSELDERDESFLRDNVEHIKVYARVSPNHKLKIVEALQNKGNIVAVTGDGVNDAPALKKGSIGVAMGQAGTDVAKEASEIVLKDDNYATIFEAVKVGRIIFDNIQKVIFFLLGSGAGFALIIIASLLLGLPLPLLATQILWVNLVTNGLQDLALAYEPGEEGIAKRPPRSSQESIISSFIVKRLVIVGIVMTIGSLGLFWYYLNQGASIIYARSVALNTVVFYQFFHVLNSRSFDRSVFKMRPLSNKFLFISLIFAIIAQVAILSWPPLQFIFSTTNLTLTTWFQTVLVGATIIVAIEIDKLVRTRYQTDKS